MVGEPGGALRMARETEARLTLAQARIVLLPSRIRILRALVQKRSTLTELSERTGIPKSTVKKHLRVLGKHGLVLRNEADRLWIYYDVTGTGRALGRLDPLRILVVCTFALGATLAAGAVASWRWGSRLRATDEPWTLPPIGVHPGDPAATLTANALAAGAAAFLALAGWLWWRARLPTPRDDADTATDTSSSP